MIELNVLRKLTKAQLITPIKAGQVSKEDISQLVVEGKLTESDINNEFSFTTAELKIILGPLYEDKLKRNLYSDEEFIDVVKKLLKDGIFTKEDLKPIFKENIKHEIYSEYRTYEILNIGILNQDDLKQIHIDNILQGHYDENKIIDLKNKGILEEHDLEPIIAEDFFLELYPQGSKVWHLGAIDESQIPDLQPNRVDVFTLGISGSGKSCFLAGLLTYADKIGKLSMLIDNTYGYDYGSKLIDNLNEEVLPPATPVNLIQYISCDFRGEKKDDKHPVTFIDMAGENFQNCFAKSINEIPPKVKKYLFGSNNRKLFFLCLDYQQDSVKNNNNRTRQKNQFDYILKFLEKNGTLKTTEAICIVVTKWDMCEDTSPDAGIKFLQSKYMSLINLCKEYQEKYKVDFRIFPFSLGVPDKRGNFIYNNNDSSFIFKWLVSFLPKIKKANGLLKIFG